MEKVIVTIARHYGSGGKTIGEMLAQKMNVNWYHRDILRMASDESGINEKLFGEVDEKLKNSPLFKITKKVYKGQLIPPESDAFISDDNLFNYQAKVIKELAAQESCVIIGRCADFILKDNPNVVSVFIHAPHEYCIERGIERTSMNAKEMDRYIEKIDKHRGDYYRYYTGNDWGNASNYDLCLDSSKLGFERCVEVIQDYIDTRFR